MQGLVAQAGRDYNEDGSVTRKQAAMLERKTTRSIVAAVMKRSERTCIVKHVSVRVFAKTNYSVMMNVHAMFVKSKVR